MKMAEFDLYGQSHPREPVGKQFADLNIQAAVSENASGTGVHAIYYYTFRCLYQYTLKYSELSTGSDGPADRVGSGWVTILPDFGGLGQHFEFVFVFLVIISWFLNLSVCSDAFAQFPR